MLNQHLTTILAPPEARNRCFALADCNNFFASCERVCNPKLNNQPIVVLSSNDGCIIARSNEAKALGIGMGKPFFKCRDLLEKHKVHVFSSNFSLYGDMSRRVMAVLDNFTPEIEIYSVDEAFLNLSGCDHLAHHSDLTEYARTIRQTVLKWTGIPISIGIGPTKTIAKIAARLAKKSKKSNKTKGVVNLQNSPYIDQALERVPIGDVWGVGHRTTQWFIDRRITNAKKLRDISDEVITNRLGVVGLRMVYELRGTSCLSLDNSPSPSKSIVSSQSFGKKTKDLGEIKGAVANHIVTASKKLRKQNLVVRILTVFLLIKKIGKEFKRNSHTITIDLPRATNDSAELIHYAMALTTKAYQENCLYVKAGVMFNNLIPDDQVQSILFPDGHVKSSKTLMEIIDGVNSSMGRGTLKYGVQLSANVLQAKSQLTTQRYTTSWHDLLTVKAR